MPPNIPLLNSILGTPESVLGFAESNFPPTQEITPPQIKTTKHRNAGIPMLTIKTDLKSLKFGGDRPDSGDSERPFIQTQIPNTLPQPSGPDFLLRQNFKFANDAFIDVERLGKWFTTVPGLQFIAKQELLSRIAVKTQASGLLNEGIYNPIYTLFEAGVTGLGIHVNKQGLLLNDGPQYLNRNTIQKVIGENVPFKENAGSYNLNSTNRLEILLGNSLNSIYDDANGSIVDITSYSGGPGSVLGLGKTHIRRSTDPTGVPISVFTNKVNNGISWDAGTLFSFGTSLYLNGTTAYDDFRLYQTIAGEGESPFFKSLPYSEIITGDENGTETIIEARNIEKRINLGDPGWRFAREARRNYVTGSQPDPNKYDYGAASPTSFDRITALPLYKSTAVNGIDPANGKQLSAEPTNDLIQFRIAAVDGTNPGESVYMHFRAFLDSINDSYTGEWNDVRYVGRGERFYTYQGFDRKVSFGFTVAAQSKVELMPMYKKLNFLASNLAPDYSSQGYMRGPIMRLTIGGYFYEQPGFITSLNYEISQDSTWEIGVGLNDETGQIIKWADGSVKELPHMIKVTVQFTPIHDFRPEKLNFTSINSKPNWAEDKTIEDYPNARYIALKNGVDKTTYSNYDNKITPRR